MMQPSEEHEVCSALTGCTVLLEITALEVSTVTFKTKTGVPGLNTRQQENQN